MWQHHTLENPVTEWLKCRIVRHHKNLLLPHLHSWTGGKDWDSDRLKLVRLSSGITGDLQASVIRKRLWWHHQPPRCPGLWLWCQMWSMPLIPIFGQPPQSINFIFNHLSYVHFLSNLAAPTFTPAVSWCLSQQSLLVSTASHSIHPADYSQKIVSQTLPSSDPPLLGKNQGKPWMPLAHFQSLSQTEPSQPSPS